ncbi:hypothetical protein FACS1894109_18020 [Spirochaetia bacterium]|nr:hypothetical protein FACS1894109_18020 [Spirochaetia bacterium]
MMRDFSAHHDTGAAVRILFVPFLLLFFSCAGVQKPLDTITVPIGIPQESPNQNGYWITHPDNGDLIVMGVANRQRKREDEIQLALDDAAHKVAIFFGVKGIKTVLTTNGSGFLDYSMDTGHVFSYDTEYEKYIDALKYDTSRDAFSIDGAFLLRVRYKVQTPLPAPHTFAMKDGMPEWIKKPPKEINGYSTGTGYGGPHSKFKDTITRAYENAIAAIIGNIATKNVSTIGAGYGGGTASTDMQISEGALAEFFVLEMWQDPNTKGVWVLAAAKSR